MFLLIIALMLTTSPKPPCTCGPACPTPVHGKWPIPASMEPVKKASLEINKQSTRCIIRSFGVMGACALV